MNSGVLMPACKQFGFTIGLASLGRRLLVRGAVFLLVHRMALTAFAFFQQLFCCRHVGGLGMRSKRGTSQPDNESSAQKTVKVNWSHRVPIQSRDAGA
jgi:hypothetical protein